jgi:hypothetical protein
MGLASSEIERLFCTELLFIFKYFLQREVLLQLGRRSFFPAQQG